jgi:Flp pilus assembly protein TadB
VTCSLRVRFHLFMAVVWPLGILAALFPLCATLPGVGPMTRSEAAAETTIPILTLRPKRDRRGTREEQDLTDSGVGVRRSLQAGIILGWGKRRARRGSDE